MYQPPSMNESILLNALNMQTISHFSICMKMIVNLITLVCLICTVNSYYTAHLLIINPKHTQQIWSPLKLPSLHKITDINHSFKQSQSDVAEFYSFDTSADGLVFAFPKRNISLT